MEINEDKQFYFEQLEAARSKRNKLPNNSLVRQALSDDLFQQVKMKLTEKSPSELAYDVWPPLYGWFCVLNEDALTEFDADVTMVAKNLDTRKMPGLIQFLKTKEGKRHGNWYGGKFDLWSKATALINGKDVKLDIPLSNNRESDLCLQVNGRCYHIESTVLTQDDESDEVWKRFCADKREDRDKILIRPGPYCPPNAKGPSPYYDSFRFYAKVFDKLTKNLDPAKSQFADD